MTSEKRWWQLSGGAVIALALAACSPPVATVSPPSTPAPTLEPTANPTPTSLYGVDAMLVQGSTDCALQITFVDNAGLMIEVGDHKVLIDALFDSLRIRDDLGRLTRAEPPFNDVDLVLVTHEHDDHFNAGMVGAHLLADPTAQFISTAGTVDRLQQEFDQYAEIADRVMTADLPAGGSQQETLSGIDVQMIDLPHGPNGPHNMGFVLTIGNCTVFHTGDVVDPTLEQFLQYDLPALNIDVALVPYMYLNNMADQPVIQQGIAAAYYVPIHHNPTQFSEGDTQTLRMAKYFPDAILFTRHMQQLVVLSAG